MSFGDVLKNFRAAANVDLRLKLLEKNYEELKKVVEKLCKDNDLFKIKKEAIDDLHLTAGKEVQHGLVKEVYDFMYDKLALLHDNESDVDIALQIQTQAIAHYWKKWERTHLAKETDPGLIKLIMLAMKPAILFIVEEYEPTYKRIFIENRNGKRRERMKEALDMMNRELCHRFDEELDKLIDLVRVFK